MADRTPPSWGPSTGTLRCDRAELNSLIAHTRPPGTASTPPDETRALLDHPATGDAVRVLLQPVHESTSQVNCALATPDRLTLRRAWITPENTTLLCPVDDVDAQLTLITTSLLPITLTTWVDLRPAPVRPDEHDNDPGGDRKIASGVGEDLLSMDAARRMQAFAVTGAECAWDLELTTAGAHLAMTILNTPRGHHEILTTAGRTALHPITATTLFRRFADILAGLPRPEAAAASNHAEAEA